MPYLATIPTTIHGIPALIGVEHYDRHRGSNTSTSDWDFYGYTEADWVILNRALQPAAWIEARLSDADEARIEQEIDRFFAPAAS